ncbi:unnamed protein product [Brachionus calyciflorus]|uniref:Helix-turn-helix domain-containing protein n=1 Tax=Brachionus calyciflorus TaxID=104777 RepID=A0A814SL00_9BILA|nr:unnamed protein product [Brachionus calyciflorus]
MKNIIREKTLLTNEYSEMLSFDVESLITNFPTLETFEKILDLAYVDGKSIFHGLKRDELKPLGPLFANIFMSGFEKKHMVELKNLAIGFWKRYVDDIFATLNIKGNAKKCLDFLNKQHPNISFTIEHECNKRTLPFLDTLVKRSLGKFTTTIYYKKTLTGVYLNWTSLTAGKYKIGLISCLLNRIEAICSEKSEIIVEKQKLKTILRMNQYPQDIIEEEFKGFENKKSKQAENIDSSIEIKRYIVLPYSNNNCEDFARRLKKLVVSNFPLVNFNVAYKTPKAIASHFRFKDNIKKNQDKSLVVYNIKCKNCEAYYIGKCKRILSYRISEHKKSSESSCCQHESNTGHTGHGL